MLELYRHALLCCEEVNTPMILETGNKLRDYICEKSNDALKHLGMGYELFQINPLKSLGQGFIFSNFDEQKIIYKYLEGLNTKSFCVDLGASDGITTSNTLSLFRDGWQGLALECDSYKFAKLAHLYKEFSGVLLIKSKATPGNILPLLDGLQVPKDFGFLNLDIDGYDYFVLEKIFETFRPSLACIEINEKIPPPLKFSVKYDPDFLFAGGHFFGQSITQLYQLCLEYRYDLVELHYNNAFLIAKEINPHPSLSPEEAYCIGYLDRHDRKEKFPYNDICEELLYLSPEDALVYVNSFFSEYEGQFVCKL